MTFTDKDILENYKNGQRLFVDIDIEDGNLAGTDLSGIWFDKCFLSIDFRRANLKGAKFTNGNIKTSDFRDSDLTDAHFENVSFESTQFKGAKTTGTIFKNNYSYSGIYQQDDFENWIKNS